MSKATKEVKVYFLNLQIHSLFLYEQDPNRLIVEANLVIEKWTLLSEKENMAMKIL